MSSLFRLLRFCGPMAPSAFFLLATLFLLSMFRLGFIVWLWPRVSEVDGLWPVLGYGVRFDLLLICFAIAVPAVCSLLLPNIAKLQSAYRRIEAIWFSVWFSIFVYMETATPSYINQYDSRPGRIFFEYLNRPKEVFGTLWADYKLQLLLGFVLLLWSLRFCWRSLRRVDGSIVIWRFRWRLFAFPLFALAIFLGARSSIGHRPANISTAAFSNDQLVNRLGINSTYSLLYAMTKISKEGRADQIYPGMPVDTMIDQLRRYMDLPDASFISAEIPTLHRQLPRISRDRPLNVVILLQESLGADFVGSLGGKPWTPGIDRLRHQGIWFENLYATGTRSVRGIEAITTGFLPTPGRSVVKLGLSQDSFFTLAELFKGMGYESSFIYGGESHFDNMRGFLLGNGFDRVVDESDYPDPKFVATWGVSDEDLFQRADEEFRKMGDRPFFSLVFSSSNHAPFEIPAGTIDEEGHSKLENAVRYSDYALSRFIEKAQEAEYWQNTLFLIVADHVDKVTGQALVPIDKFHIPALIMGADIEPQIYTKIASQSDLPTTLLGLVGKETTHPMVGRDLLAVSEDDPGRAVMQFGLNHATMFGDEVIIHQPHLSASQFKYIAGDLEPVELDLDLVRQATALALWPSYAYLNQQYRLPDQK